MATVGQTKIFNGDFNINWSFNVLQTPRTGVTGAESGREPLFSSAGAAVDDLVDWLDREDSTAVRTVCYGFFALGFFYLAGHVLLALVK